MVSVEQPRQSTPRADGLQVIKQLELSWTILFKMMPLDGSVQSESFKHVILSCAHDTVQQLVPPATTEKVVPTAKKQTIKGT